MLELTATVSFTDTTGQIGYDTIVLNEKDVERMLQQKLEERYHSDPMLKRIRTLKCDLIHD